MTWGPQFQKSTNFDFELSKGNIEGHTALFLTMETDFMNPTLQTVWEVNAAFVWPTGDETWEVVSSDTDDTAAGTGARTVLIEGLDTNFDVKTETVTLNGTTPVTTTTTDWNRITTMIVATAGSSETNEGTLTLRVASAGNIRTVILPTASRSFNGMYTVPAGKTAMIRQNIVFTPKGEDATTSPRLRLSGGSVWISAGGAPTYQNGIIIQNVSMPILPSQTDLEFRSLSTNSNTSLSIGIEVTLIDNKFIGTA